MKDQKTTILFIMLSAIILIGWQLWFGLPQQKPVAPQNPPVTTAPGTPGTPAPGTTAPGTTPGAPPAPGIPIEPTKPLTREEALAQSPRVRMETPRVSGSVALKG